MTSDHLLYLEGVAFWTPALPHWDVAQAALRGEANGENERAGEPSTAIATSPATGRPNRPAGALLGANERRRAPDTVLLALEVAHAAIQQAGRDAAEVASVFTSTHGDLAIVDALCSTLAADPLLLSPTRFHHSVHNAASGYWAIASGCQRGSSAVAHFGHAFAAGWLEAASLCAADAAPVLLVGFDSAARGALASANTSQGLLGVALVLAPQPSVAARWRVRWRVQPTPSPRPEAPLRSAAARALQGNALADALPLFEALARPAPATLHLPLGPQTGLGLALEPLPRPA